MLELRRIRFVSAVTHELRTPLTTLRLYLDMLVHGLVRDEAQRVIANLALAYREDRALLADCWQRGPDEVDRLRGIADFIAGMTDRFAIARHEELVGPVTLPDRF